ncbi:hypothetical protein [Deinococcus sp.]|uniref:beta strand repeat-containing protein n=1 Tax=Deinococcus sp. TaxID=47478 RepID=UPI0025BA5204|nr:hypothetical protein [Deinococcus sp.]
MKLNKMLALAISLSTGMALGAPVTAGTAITNQASADFEVLDPTSTTPTTPITASSVSNIVTTTVSAVPSYTITPNAGDAALIKNNVPASTNTTFTYTVTNTGNTPLVIALSSANTTTDTAPTGVTLSATTVTVQPGATATVTQTYTVGGTPATYGQNLIGTATYDSTPSADGTGDSYTETFTGNVDNNNQNKAIVAAVTTATPGSPTTGTVTPIPTDSTNPGITPVDTNNPTGPGTTSTGYTNPSVPGGATLPGAGTPVQVAPDGSQNAYPKADADGNPDVVTMTGTAPNNSTVPDNITVGPATVPSTAPAGTTATLINPKTGNPFVTGEVPVDINGNPITGATVTVNPDGSVTFNNVPAGQAPAYTVQVTYPDAGADNTGTPKTPIAVTVPIFSGNAGGPAAGSAAQIASPVYTVKTPGLDLRVVAQDTGATLDASDQPIHPSTTGTTNADFSTTLQNTGTYNDTFNITDGTNDLPAGATVQYLLNGTALTDTNGDGTVDVGAVTPGTTVTFTTRVILPANAPARAGYAVRAVATGAYSTATDTDGTLFNVGVVTAPTPPAGNPTNPLFPITKTVDKTTAAPGDTVVYTINGKNNYNVPACKVIFKELDGTNTNIFANTTYQSVAGTASVGSLLFSTDNGANWSATAPAGGINPASLWIGVNTNGDTTIDSADCLPIGGTADITLTVKVKN